MPKPPLTRFDWHPKLRARRETVFRVRADKQGRIFLGFAGLDHVPLYFPPSLLPDEQRRELDITFMKYVTGVDQYD